LQKMKKTVRHVSWEKTLANARASRDRPRATPGSNL
jgi:hypothetical protein